MTPGLKRASVCVLCLALAAPLPALAHHSFSMFDRDKTTSIAGTVKDYSLINPHSWVVLVAPGAEGHPVEWSLETGSPNQLRRNGWDGTTLKPGDKVTASIHPMKDGSNGGQLVSLTLADGRTLDGQRGFGR